MADKYVLIIEYEDYDPEFDQRIENAIGRERNGSGYGLASGCSGSSGGNVRPMHRGVRDITFGFSQKPAAKRALARARRFRKYNCGSWIMDPETGDKIVL